MSNFILGHGPWTIYQMVGWGIMGIIGGLVNYNNKKKPNNWLNALIGFGFGFFYGWLMNVWFWALYVSPHSLKSWIFTNLMSFYFDLSHGIANFVFLYYFGNRTINMLYRYRERFLTVFVEEVESLSAFPVPDF